MSASHANLNEFLQALRQVVPAENLFTDPAECWAYGYDNSRRQGHPEAVVFPTDAEQIQAIVHLCNYYHIPLLARGRGTGTPGGSVPLEGGVVLSCERMQRILHVDPANRAMIVEPGVLNKTIQTTAAEYGFFWAPDPSSAAYCTVGGNLAYNSAGPRAVKYGTTRENTLGLKIVTGAGNIVHTGTYTTKSAVGYDLTRLVIGSEGTLAIITEATLKLIPLPEQKQTIRAVYRNIDAATQAIAKLMSQAMTPCGLEFIDNKAIALLRDQGVELPAHAGALLLIEVDGLACALEASAAKLVQAATNADLIEIKVANTAEEMKQLWEARKALSPALRTIAPGKINEDVVVPVSRIPELIKGLEKLSAEYQINIVNFGHAGNGNIHVNLLIDSSEPVQRQHAEQCLNKVFDLTLKLDGSLSGEHGIGIEKRDFINRELSATSLDLMRQIKTVFDPNHILNPGKLFPV